MTGDKPFVGSGECLICDYKEDFIQEEGLSLKAAEEWMDFHSVTHKIPGWTKKPLAVIGEDPQDWKGDINQRNWKLRHE